ncbi:hypothetical protein C4546_00885 [Candidatus Parcubacteria bacterium]|nr:MAG: hypothetical protein C4546_00885 [Candidatus Parcubacteria bacterium]
MPPGIIHWHQTASLASLHLNKVFYYSKFAFVKTAAHRRRRLPLAVVLARSIPREEKNDRPPLRDARSFW